MAADLCHYCQKGGDLRPYGPNGSMVCFQCATATPERDTAAKAAFIAQVDACGDCAMVDGTNVGPYPASVRLTGITDGR